MLRMIRNILSKPELKKLSDKAKRGDKASHELIMEKIKSGEYNMYSSTNVRYDVKIKGDVTNSIVIAGSDNVVVTLDKEEYVWFDEIVQTAVFGALKQQHISDAIGLGDRKGAVAFFSEDKIDQDLDAAIGYIVSKSKNGDQKAMSVMASLREDPRVTTVTDYLFDLFLQSKGNKEIAGSLCMLLWTDRENDKLREAVDLLSLRYKNHEKIVFCSAILYEKDTKLVDAFDQLSTIYKRKSNVTNKNAEIQIDVRRFMLHILRKNNENARSHFSKSFDPDERIDKIEIETIELCDKFVIDFPKFSDRKLELLKARGENIGSLEFLEDRNSASFVREKAKTILSSGDAQSAKHLYAKCLSQDRKNSDFDGMIDDLVGLVRACLELKEYKQAEKYVTEATNFHKRSGCMPGYLAGLNALAEIRKTIIFKGLEKEHKIDRNSVVDIYDECIRLSESFEGKKEARRFKISKQKFLDSTKTEKAMRDHISDVVMKISDFSNEKELYKTLKADREWIVGAVKSLDLENDADAIALVGSVGFDLAQEDYVYMKNYIAHFQENRESGFQNTLGKLMYIKAGIKI